MRVRVQIWTTIWTHSAVIKATELKEWTLPFGFPFSSSSAYHNKWGDMNHGLECLRIDPTIWFKIKQINKQEFKNYAKNSAHYVKNSAQQRGAWPEPHLKYTQIGTQIVLQGRVLSFPQLHLTKIFLQKCHQYCECKMYFVHRNVHEKIYALLIGWKRVHSSCDMCTKLRHERKLQIILKNY